MRPTSTLSSRPLMRVFAALPGLDREPWTRARARQLSAGRSESIEDAARAMAEGYPSTSDYYVRRAEAMLSHRATSRGGTAARREADELEYLSRVLEQAAAARVSELSWARSLTAESRARLVPNELADLERLEQRPADEHNDWLELADLLRAEAVGLRAWRASLHELRAQARELLPRPTTLACPHLSAERRTWRPPPGFTCRSGPRSPRAPTHRREPLAA